MAALPDISIDAAFRKFLHASRTILFIKLDRQGRIQRTNRIANEVLSRFGEPEGESFPQFVLGLESMRIEDMIAQFFDSNGAEGSLIELGTSEQVSLKYRFTAESVSDGYFLFGEPSMEASQRLREDMVHLRDSFSDAMRQLGKRSNEGRRLEEGLREAERLLERQASTDPLTGLANRREFTRALRREWGRFSRYGRTYSVTLAEVTGFEELTGSETFAAGEAAVVMVGELIGSRLRSTDLVARFGERQFVVLQFETPMTGARYVEDRLRKVVRETEIPLPIGGAISIALGVGEVSDADDHADDVLQRAQAELMADRGRGARGPEAGDAS